MPVTALDHVNIRLPRARLDAVRDFYVDVLGCEVGDRPPFASPGYWLYAGGRPVVHLIEAPQGTAVEAPAGNVVNHFALLCSDYDAMCERLDRAGIGWRATAIPGIGQRQLFLKDPAGVGVELLFDAPQNA